MRCRMNLNQLDRLRKSWNDDIRQRYKNLIKQKREKRFRSPFSEKI